MLAAAVSHLFKLKLPRFKLALAWLELGRSRPLSPAAPIAAATEAKAATSEVRAEAKPPTLWPAARLALTNQLWGTGFIFPGGETETLRLVRPLGTTAAASLLIIGVGSGGPASAVTRNLGTWVTGMESDPSLVAAARGMISRAQLGKKVLIDTWDPANPMLAAKSHHHCLAMLPLSGERPEPILTNLAKALKPGGQLVMTELTAKVPLDTNDATVKRWAKLERRNPAGVIPGVSITRMLGRVGLDVRIAEDITDRHLEDMVLGWRLMLRDLEEQEGKPSRQQAALMVGEAELWLMRWRLMKQGHLKMMRWHAINRIPIV